MLLMITFCNKNKAVFGSCKSISEKYSIFRKCYFSERKMFSCVWLHFKKCFEKYFLVFGCVLENTIKNTFSTCCSHFLTFSWLPNEYIISIIPQYRNTNKTQKKKSSNPVTFSRLPNKYVILFIPQYRNTDKTQKKKIIKSGQIERRRKRERRLGSTRGEIAWRRRRRDWRGASRDRDRREGEIVIDGAIFLPLHVHEIVLSLSLSPFARL